jgi:hypothetical protein
MAIDVGSTGTALAYGTRTNSTLTAPASIANGDLLVNVMHAGNASLTALAITPPAGWSAIPNDPSTKNAPDPYSIAMHVFYKVASGESGNYTFTHSSGETEGFIYRLTGADTTTPLDVTPTQNNGVGGTTVYPAITPVTDGAFLIYAESDWDAPGSGTISGTPTITARRAGTISWIGDGTQTTAAAIGTRNRVNGNVLVGNPWVSTVVAFRASGTPPAPFDPTYIDWPLRQPHPKMRGAA